MLTIVGESHDPIFTLENPLRETLVDSRIPDGQYECCTHSGPRFQDVYEVKDVPERTEILIHCGNFEKDTTGCILLGLGAVMYQDGQPMVTSSKLALDKFRKLVGAEPFLLTIAPEITSF